MTDRVPTAKRLSDVYYESDIPAQTPRWQSLKEAFENLYGHAPEFVARSPGRVNIIGEHIDYSLYPVLPTAITADALIAVSCQSLPENDTTFTIKIANVRCDSFPTREFEVPVNGEVEIDASVHEWTNYFKSGLKGAFAAFASGKIQRGVKHPVSMKVLMDGTVPVGGGLSSSAAFTTASALAVLFAYGVKEIGKFDLTSLAIVSERSVGVNSGGMDQSASVFSQRGSALSVEFSPKLIAKPIPIPPTVPKLVFMVAQSFVAADKQVTGPIHYNLRVVECTLAAAYLNAKANPPDSKLPHDESPLGMSLKSFSDAYQIHHPDGKEPTDLVKEYLPKEEGYTREEIAKVLNKSVSELESQFMSKFPVRAERFKLQQRAMHVFTEAGRVQEFIRTLDELGSTNKVAELSEKLGRLMNETQDSCRDLYECSCPEIDRICEVARRAGAYGSRLTGAGWGGCTVHLVPEEKVESVKEALVRDYYRGMDLTREQKDSAMVVSLPGSGSCLAVLDDFSWE